MSDLRPSLATGGGGDISHAAAAADASAGHMAVETQLTTQTDIAAAHRFFQPATVNLPTPTFTGAEATAVAGKAATAAATSGAEASAVSAAAKSLAGIAHAAGAEAAAFGAHAAGAAAGAAGAAEVSPMIQLIMRLPGLGGVAQSFFEWLSALFTAPSHLMEVFDPNMWSHLAGSLQSGLTNLTMHGIGAEHFQVPLSMLPSNAPFLQNLGMQVGHGMSDVRFIGMGSSVGTTNLPSMSLQNQFNISGPLDLKKAQFEIGQSANPHSGLQLDGKMSGPHMSNNVNTNFLSGTQRLFSDKMSGPTSLLSPSNTAGGANNIISNASSPAGASSSLNISSNAFGQDVGSLPANYNAADGIISGPNVSSANNIGYHLSDSAGATLDKAPSLSPSGGVSDTLGGKELIANNDGAGSYFKPAGSPSSEAGAQGGNTDSGMTGLKAEPMSLLKKQPALGHTPDRGAVDYIGHQSKGAMHATSSASSSATNAPSAASHHGPAMDQIAHRGVHHAGTEAAGRQIAYKHVSGDPSSAGHAESHAIAHAKVHTAPARQAAAPRMERISAQAQPANGNEMMQEQSQSQGADQGIDQTATTDKTAMTDAGSDRIGSNYTVQRGDNLWDIARKQLGDGTRWHEIYKLNSDLIGNNPDLIHSGLGLKMPGADTTQITDASAGNYTVQPGDNLWDIAKDKLGDGSRWGEIYHANEGVIGANPRLIFSGQQLQMPGAQMSISQGLPQATPAPIQQAPSVDPNAYAQPTMAEQALPPQAMAPQGQGYFQTNPSAAKQVLGGPGAAAAATLDATQAPTGPVSPSLAPDLSFLYGNNKTQ